MPSPVVDSGSGEPAVSDPGTGAPEPSVCTSEALRGSSQTRYRRLSGEELERTLLSLFGAQVMSAATVSVRAIPKESHGFDPQLFASALTPSHLEAMNTIARELSAAAAENVEFVRRYGGCESLAERACVRSFLQNFGARAFRSPVGEGELARYMEAFDADPDVEAAVLIHALLLDARFNLLIENGTLDGERFRLNDFEVAARISYRTTGDMPDDELWQAAVAGGLQTQSAVRAQVERLLSTQGGRAHLQAFFRNWFEVDEGPDVGVTAAYRGDIDVNQLYEAATKDFDRFVEHVVFGGGTLKDLFTDTTVFPETRALATIYGAPVVGAGLPGVPATSGHQGMLLRTATLMGGGNRTAAIHRGVMVRRRLLCDELPFPGQDIVNARDDDLKPEDTDHSLNSNRDIIRNITRAPACAVCHTQINPIGFAMEDFDSLGRRQTEEPVFSSDDQLVATHTVNAAVEQAAIEDGAPDTLSGSHELNAVLSDSAKVKACIARQLLRFHYLATEQSRDACILREQEAALAQGASLLTLIVSSIANDDIFWRGR